MKQTRHKDGQAFVFDWHAATETPPQEGAWYWTKRRDGNSSTVIQQIWRTGCVGTTWWVWSEDGQGYVPTDRTKVEAWAEITEANEDYL